jgi:glycogen debranching enzyme
MRPVNEGTRSLDKTFYIPAAVSLDERRYRTLKHDDLFALFDQRGDIQAAAGAAEGIYYRDTRHLSHLSLSIGDQPPLLLSSTVRDDNATLTCDLTNPDLYAAGRLVLKHDLIHLRRSKFLWEHRCFERITIRNFDDGPRAVNLGLHFAADFVDLFEIRGTARARRGQLHRAQVERDSSTLAYDGLDGLRRQTRLHFEPAPRRLTADSAIFYFALAPREHRTVFIEIACSGDVREAALGERFFTARRNARQALQATGSRTAAIETSNQLFNEVIRRAVSDLHMLITELPEGPYPYAGIPWFSTVFGRDGLITALQTLWADPSIARGVLAYLAANQAQQEDPASDAEPGKILHEVRHGEMAALGEVPFGRYYGSVDATPLFVVLAGAYLARTGDSAFVRSLWPNIEAALAWIGIYGDQDGDGFVEYGRRSQAGLANQGWKDSADAVFHADGALAEGPVALAEVQSYVYAAERGAAAIAGEIGLAERAAALDAAADARRLRFDAAFWDEELGTYVLALDRDKRPCRVRTSNAGHALFSGIALPPRTESVVRNLMDRASYSGWGIRTLPSTEARYNPMSYHNGSVWPHDNALIAAGFARYGFAQEAARVFQGLFEASVYADLRRLPELLCGFERQHQQGPTAYPVACSPQAWATAAHFSLLQSCLGLDFEPRRSSVTFCRPLLPTFLDEVILRGLMLGRHQIDVALRRKGEEVVADVLSSSGDIRVTTIS